LAIAMYHDQGMIPIKLLAYKRGVNMTLGLPFVRTSPCHGTAYDLAGKWVADSGSMLEALKVAAKACRFANEH
ncbi:MAG: 4-hydroxythreonine-4-phosphate dehydrogenase PdxA, partial [Patescibacteria group bacterium]